MRTTICSTVGIAVLVLLASQLACGGGETTEDPWNKVQTILTESNDTVVLDGTDKAALKYDGMDEPAFGDWMVRHALSDPENFNPYTSSDQGATQVHTYVFESLLEPEYDPPYTQRGFIAADYPVVSDDYLTYTFTLRQNVRFADGTPLTADDVLFSMKVIQTPTVRAPHLRNYYSSIQDVEKLGEYEISFVCREPYILNDLFLGSFDILPRHFYDPDGLLDPVPITSLIDGSWEQGEHADRVRLFGERFNLDFNRNMMGTGAYYVADWENDVVTGQKVVLTRNDDYWGQDVAGLPATGHVDKIVFKIINNLDAAFIELTNGNLDYHGMKPLEFKEKSWSPGFVDRFMKGIQYAGGYNYIGWNNNHPLFRDRRVRQAMTHLTDREGMVRNLLFGLAETVESPIHKFRPEYNHALEPYPYDPDRALALLDAAGWADTDNDGILDKEIDGTSTPFRFEFLVNSGNQIRKDIALTLQSSLEDVGIDCQVRELDWSIFLERVKNKDFAAVTLGWTGGTGLRFPPDSFQIWHSSQAEGNGSNFISFRNEETDEILETYRQEFDMDKRIVLYRRFQEILHEEQPYTFLWKSRVAVAYSRRYHGVNWYPAGAVPQEWWVEPADRLYQ